MNRRSLFPRFYTHRASSGKRTFLHDANTQALRRNKGGIETATVIVNGQLDFRAALAQIDGHATSVRMAEHI